MTAELHVLSSSVRELMRHGQAIWLDYIRRSLLAGGELDRLMRESGVSGLTSNPTIFEKAIAGTAEYDASLAAALAREAHSSAEELFWSLAVEDIAHAADRLRPVWEASGGMDGYVSLEISPALAHDTAGSVAQARQLWQRLARPNVMIKVPATPEGVAALEQLIAEGISVNATLIFSLRHYEAVAAAYLRGLARTEHPERVSSVASVFVSRVDTAVDRALAAIGTPAARALLGTIAIAHARRIYRRFRELFAGEAFAEWRRRGAHLQRLLWASTSTKNPAYRDVLYVEELIGPDTVNTMPPATLAAFADHGRVRGATAEEDYAGALERLASLEKVGIQLEQVCEQLQAEGVEAFSHSFASLLATLERKRQQILSARLDRQTLVPAGLAQAIQQRLGQWEAEGFARRLWARDYRLWSPTPVPEITDRLGWLELPERMHEQASALGAFARQVCQEGFEAVVLLGMGGSSLAPEVFARIFGNAPGWPRLLVLDSTHPAAVRAVEQAVPLPRTLFVVSSKSGTTTETLSFFRYFWHRLPGDDQLRGKQFIAITDPGTPLEQLAQQRGFRQVFLAPPDLGGRYSALSPFGLVPAALIGLDIHRLLDRAWEMAEACAFCVPVRENPALQLAVWLGEAARAGRDKLTFLAEEALAALPVWLEQLVAESTGKQGKGILPVEGEPLASAESYGDDRVFAYFALAGESASLEAALKSVEAAGHPVARIRLGDRYDLAQEFWRWEMAIAAAGSVLGIHPFNQPDVQLAKDLARQAMQGGAPEAAVEVIPVENADLLRQRWEQWLARVGPRDYIALQAYLEPNAEIAQRLQQLRQRLRRKRPVATTLGFGPRFLHSTGQYHKGGPNAGVFLQLIDQPAFDLAVPETNYSFGQLLRAQADGDAQALVQRGRRLLRVHVGRDPVAGLGHLLELAGA